MPNPADLATDQEPTYEFPQEGEMSPDASTKGGSPEEPLSPASHPPPERPPSAPSALPKSASKEHAESHVEFVHKPSEVAEVAPTQTQYSTKSGQTVDTRKSTSSRKSRKSNLFKRAGTLQKVASFANNLAMDEDELQHDEDMGEKGFGHVQSVENETGTERLQRALTTETKHKGLFKYTNTLGQTNGMEPDMLMRVALEDEWQMVSCASLPFTVIFFVNFICFFQIHYAITDVFLAEYPFRRVLGDLAWDINTVPGIYDWFDEYYFPYVWATQPQTPPEEALRTSNLYAKLIGGVMLTTARAKIAPCEDDLVKHIRCHGEVVDHDSGDSFFGRRLAWSAAAPAFSHGPRSAAGQSNATFSHLRNISHPRNIAQPTWAENTASERWAAYLEAEAAEHRLKWSRKHKMRASRHFRGDRGHREWAGDELVRPRHETFLESASRRLKRWRPDLGGEVALVGDGNQSTIVESAVKTLDQVRGDLNRWKDLKLLRENTLTLRAEALFVNDNLGHDLIMLSTYDFSIHSSGSVFAECMVVTLISTEVATDVVQASLGILFFVCLCVFSYMLPSRAIMRWRQGRLRSHFMRFWNLVEWFIILWGWMLVLGFSYERHLIWNLKDKIEEYNKEVYKVAPWVVDEINQKKVPELLDQTKEATNVSMWVQLLVSLFHIVLVFRFFLASRGQPRLAIVLSTIRKASIDLLHLFMVFMVVFLAYAVSGHMLFGRRLKEFSTFSAAFARCFQIVMEREYPWQELTDEDQWTATIWVWSFMVLVVMIMVNIFLAMIFDTYGDVRSSVGHSATLLQTTKIVLAHLRHLLSFSDEMDNRWVPNRELVQSVKGMHCNHVTPWMVKDAFPGIDNKQVNYLFNLAKNRLENMLVRGNKTSLPAVVASTLLAVERMHQGLRMMRSSFAGDEQRSTVASTTESVSEGFSQATITGADTNTSLPKMSDVGSDGAANADSRRGSDTDIKPPSLDKSGSRVAFDVKQDSQELHSIEYPQFAPHWFKVQVLPHFQKTKNLLMQVHVQVQRIDRAMHMRGISRANGIPKNPEETPRQLRVSGALGMPESAQLPCGPSGATSFAGHMLPAAVRESQLRNSARDCQLSQQNLRGSSGSRVNLFEAFTAPDKTAALPSPPVLPERQVSIGQESTSRRNDCCTFKPMQPLHE